MDRFNARLLSAMAEVLMETNLNNSAEQAEVREIAARLKALSLGKVDELCCERISRELDERATHKPNSKRLA